MVLEWPTHNLNEMMYDTEVPYKAVGIDPDRPFGDYILTVCTIQIMTKKYIKRCVQLMIMKCNIQR